MEGTVDKTMAQVLMERLEGTRKERQEHLAEADRCLWIEGRILSMLSGMGYADDAGRAV